nr:putative reverse transcriptase domain-containing protein [Tanacetum cinerariifolium]
MRTCPPRVLKSAQRSFNLALHSSLSVLSLLLDQDLAIGNGGLPPYLLHLGGLVFILRPCSVCSRVFVGVIYGDHVVSCAGIISIKHRYNVVRDTFVDIYYRYGISADKEVDIGLDGWRDKPLHFVPGRAMIDAAQRKRGKYMANYATIRYGLLPISFSFLGKLEADAVTLLKQIRKFSMAQDIGAQADAVTLLKQIRKLSMAQDIGAHVDDDDLDLGKRNIKQCKRKICDGHYTAAAKVLSSSSVAPYSEVTLEDLKTKHPFHPAPSLPQIPIDHHHLIASLIVVLDRIKSFLRGSSCGDDVGLSMLLVDFKNAFNLVDQEQSVFASSTSSQQLSNTATPTKLSL